MKRIILFAPVFLLIYINSIAGGTTGSNSPLAVVANFTASVTTGCAPLSTQFTSTSTSDVGDPIVSYYWDFGDLSTSISPNPSHTYTSEGDYTVKLTVTTQSGAKKTVTKSDFISAYNKPVFDFGADYTICEGQSVTLKTIVGAGYVYNWTGVVATTW